MAHIFLSDLKTTLDNCIAELEEIHFMFCKNPESYFTRNRKLSFHEGQKGYNAVHINALYDITNKTYCDFLVHGKKKLHERAALNTMIDRYANPVPAILMADRGYESFNTFAHLIPEENEVRYPHEGYQQKWYSFFL